MNVWLWTLYKILVFNLAIKPICVDFLDGNKLFFPFFFSLSSPSPFSPGMLSRFALWLHVTRWWWYPVTWLIAVINAQLLPPCCHGFHIATLFCVFAYMIFPPKVPMVHGATPATVSAATTSATSVPFAATATANQVC